MAELKEVDALPVIREAKIRLGCDQHGSVKLIDAMPRLIPEGSIGPEAAIVQAARVSYGAGTKIVTEDRNLVNYLMRNKHMTPFEMVVLKFRIVAPKFTATQWMRHRAGSFNEESARYSEISSECYVPDNAEVKVQSETNKQGGGALAEENVAAQFARDVADVCEHARRVYEGARKQGVAREMARIVLPEGRYTTFYWQVNLRNLFGFLELRMDPHAQDNIRAYATAIWGILRGYCPVACDAFERYVINAVALTAPEILELQAHLCPEPTTQDRKRGLTGRERTEWMVKRSRLGLPEKPAAK